MYRLQVYEEHLQSQEMNFVAKLVLAESVLSLICLTNNAVRRMVTTKQYDNLNRLTQISNTGGTGSTLSSFTYTYL